MKYFVLAVLFLVYIPNLYSQDHGLSVNFHHYYDLTLRSINEQKTFYLSIGRYNKNETISKVNIKILPNEDLNISPTEFSVDDFSQRSDSATVPLEISSKKKRYTSTSIPIKIEVEADNSIHEKTLYITLLPVKYFWFKISLVMVIILLAAMSVVYMKLMKGEKQNEK